MWNIKKHSKGMANAQMQLGTEVPKLIIIG